MKIRHDVVFVSSVLFTIGLLSIVQGQWWNALPGEPKTLDAGWRMSAQLSHELALANLSTIAIALIVIWTGYVKRLRSAWFIMFIVVCIWFFPQAGVWRLNYSNVSEWLPEAAREPGLSRVVVELLATCALMVIGLFLPIKSFFWRRMPVTHPSKPGNDHTT